MTKSLQHRTEAQEAVGEITVAFALSNLRKPTVNFAELYMTENVARDVAWGNLKLTIANKGAEAIEFTKESLLEILIPDMLLRKSELERVRLGAGSQGRWSLQVGDRNSLLLTLIGEGTLKLTAGERHELVLEQLFAVPPRTVESAFTFEWSGVTGQRDESQDFKVLTMVIPSEASEARLGFDWMTREEYAGLDTVYTTPWTIGGGKEGIANRLLLRLVNNDDNPLENDGAYLRVTFFTEDYGSMGLLTAEQLKQVQCKVLQPVGSAWKPDPDMTGKATSWLLQPPKDATVVLQKSELMVFEFSNLVTKLNTGSSAVLINWGGIKGRNAGHTILPVTKALPTPYVRAYGAKKGSTLLRDGDTVDFKDEVTLTADLFAADSFLLEALPGERFPWPPVSKAVRPDRALTDLKLTPTVQLPTVIRPGSFSPFSLRVSEPTATLSASIQGNGMPKLVWDCTDGDCSLSGPGMTRTPVDRKGERAVSQPGWYEIECAGTKTVKARAFARLAHPFCAIGITGGGPRGRVSWRWRTQYATSCEVHFDGFSSDVLNGDGGGGGWPRSVNIVARGNGTATLQFNSESFAKVPDVSFVEEKLPDSGLYRIKWNLPGGNPQVVCVVRGTLPLWTDSRGSGEVTKDYSGQARFYSVTANAGGNASWNYNMKVESNL